MSKALLCETAEKTQSVSVSGIDFIINYKSNSIVNLVNQGDLKLEGFCESIYFLGMVTLNPEGSDRWGMCDRLYSYQFRAFVGDRIGRIVLKYSDGTRQNIPVIFGVNIWPYELFDGISDDDSPLTVKGGAYAAGPFDEPFASDESARTILKNSLTLNDGIRKKHMRYIFALDSVNKEIKSIEIIDEQKKSCGFVISAVTISSCAGNQECADKMITHYDYEYFLYQKYLENAAKLSRRLYQYADSIKPKAISDDIKTGIKTSLKFGSTVNENVMSCVYHHNMYDMCMNKVDSDGGMHTSTLDAPSFGRYVGFGTFKEKDGAYYKQIWGRDAGRMMIEMILLGEYDKALPTVEQFIKYLYDPGSRYGIPNWKRVINGSEVAVAGQMKHWEGRENDGHGLILIFLCLFAKISGSAAKIIRANWKSIEDAVDWYIFQMRDPDASNFADVLYADSEPAGGGGYDMYSNHISLRAIGEAVLLAKSFGYTELASKWSEYYELLSKGINTVFVNCESDGRKYFVDQYTCFDSWIYGFKVLAPLLTAADCECYDVFLHNKDLYEISLATYQRMTDQFHSSSYPRIMGYCQAFALQAALLLEMQEDIDMLTRSTAEFCYNEYDHSYIVPEGVIIHPTGKYWFRNGDLGNSVQQAEVIKCIRLIVGIDILAKPGSISFIPRLPRSYSEIRVSGQATENDPDKTENQISMIYKRSACADGYTVHVDSNEGFRLNYFRVGPFNNADTEFVLKNNTGTEGLRIDKIITISGNKYAYVVQENESDDKIKTLDFELISEGVK